MLLIDERDGSNKMITASRTIDDVSVTRLTVAERPAQRSDVNRQVPFHHEVRALRIISPRGLALRYSHAIAANLRVWLGPRYWPCGLPLCLIR